MAAIALVVFGIVSISAFQCLVAINEIIFSLYQVLFALAIDFYVAHPDHAGALPVLILSFIGLLLLFLFLFFGTIKLDLTPFILS